MNKLTECFKRVLSISSILNVLAQLAIKMSCIKRANIQNQFKQKHFFQREKQHVQRFKFSLLQTFHSRKGNCIFATSIEEGGVPLQNLKIYKAMAQSYQTS